MKPEEIEALGVEIQGQIKGLAARQAGHPGAAAAPFNFSAFSANVLKLLGVAQPFIPGVAGEVVGALLPILNAEIGKGS